MIILMRQLPQSVREQIVDSLVGGNSISTTSKEAGASRNTVANLLVSVGAACSHYQNLVFGKLKWRHLETRRVGPLSSSTGKGAWALAAIDPDTDVVPSFWVTNFDYVLEAAIERQFVLDTAKRFAVETITSTHSVTPGNHDVDGMWHFSRTTYLFECKHYQRYEGSAVPLNRCRGEIGETSSYYYSPMGTGKAHLAAGRSLFEAAALYFAHYNFARLSRRLDLTPAMAAGITKRQWDVSDLIALLDREASKPKNIVP
jgi:hypothetical protein